MSKILIVDDDYSIARLISDALEDEGYETVIKTDGKTAYDYIVGNLSEISLITLDIMMPEFSGTDLCKFVRNRVNCPIIFVSAKGTTLDAIEGFEAGGDDYITKPFVVEEFVARVKAHLRRDVRSFGGQAEGIIKVGDTATFQRRCCFCIVINFCHCYFPFRACISSSISLPLPIIILVKYALIKPVP